VVARHHRRTQVGAAGGHGQQDADHRGRDDGG
jgi:hypothetical protein